jgi:hypothetical protein
MPNEPYMSPMKALQLTGLALRDFEFSTFTQRGPDW